MQPVCSVHKVLKAVSGMQYVSTSSAGLGQLTDAIVGGAPMPPSMLREFAYHGVRAISTWGETLHACMMCHASFSVLVCLLELQTRT